MAVTKKTLAQEFRDRTQDILTRSQETGISLNQVCKGANAARATPIRWSKRVPISILLVDVIDAELSRLEKLQAKEKEQ